MTLRFITCRGRIDIGPHGGPILLIDTVPAAVRGLIESGTMADTETVWWYRRADRIANKMRNAFIDADVDCFLPETLT